MQFQPMKVDRIALSQEELAARVRTINDQVLAWMKTYPPAALTPAQLRAIDDELVAVIKILREAGCDKYQRRRASGKVTAD